MGIFSSKTDFKFLDDCGKRLSQVDKSLTALAFSIDSIHCTLELLIKQLEKTFSKDTDEVPALSLTRNLLSNVGGTLYHQKMAALEGINDLIHTLEEKVNARTRLEKHLPTLKDLNIDIYIREFQKEHTGYKYTSKQSLSVSNETDVDHEITLDNMKKDIKQLEKENTNLKFTNTMLKTEYDEANSSKEATENKCERLNSELKVLKEENLKLQEALEKAHRNVELIPVQLYVQRRGNMTGHIGEELRTKINDHLSLTNRELEVIRCETTAEIQPNKPLLVVCISTSRLGTDAKSAILGVSNLEHCALLIFHHKHEYALPSESSDRVLAGLEFKALCGIFDLAFLTEEGIYNCKMNSRAITDIVKFISKEYTGKFSSK